MARVKKATANLPVPVKTNTKALAAAGEDKAAEAKAAKEAYEQMNDKLKKAAQHVCSMLLNLAQEGITRMWKLGEFVRKIRDNEETYGEDAIHLLEKVVGKSSKSTIQKALTLNSWLTEAQLAKMLELKMKITGKALSWQHYEKLLTIKDKDKRDAVLKETINKELTPEEVQKLALHARGEDAPHAGGRPVAVPPTFTAKAIHYLKRMNAIVRDADAIYDNSEHGFHEAAESMPADKITPDMVEKTQEMMEVTRTVLDFTRQFVLRLEETNAILQKRMNAQAQQQGKEEAEKISTAIDAEVEDDEEDDEEEAEVVAAAPKGKTKAKKGDTPF